MIKSNRLFIFIFFLNCLHIYCEDIKILVLPFLNGLENIELKYISEVIPNSFNLLLEGVPEYTSVTYYELSEYMKENNLGIGDFYNRDTLMAIAAYFGVDNIVRGEYYEDDTYTPKRLEFRIEYIEIDYEEEILDIIYNMKIGGQSGIYALDTLDTIVETMLEDFLGVVMEFAFIEVKTDLPCELYIDNALMGVTPFEQKKLTAGKHHIRVYYEGENISGDIFNDEISLAKNEEKELSFQVFVDLELSAELECSLYLDDEYIGVTPYEGNLLTGNEYNLKVMYEQEYYSEVVSDNNLDTSNNQNIAFYFPVTGSINILTDNNPASPLRVELNELPENILPYCFTEMPLGNYDIEVIAYDEEHDRRYIFYEENVYLNPDENRDVDLSYINYEKKPGYCLVPGLSQFYNRQPVKGRIVLIPFITGAVTAGLAPLISYIYRKRVYEPMLEDFNVNGTNSGYTRTDIDETFDNIDKIFNSMLISGISTAFTASVYSLIDGAVNMRRLNTIFNPQDYN